MQNAPIPGKTGPKSHRLDHDRETPAYRVIYGVFGSLADFCKAAKIPPGTAHEWLKSGLIPAARQQAIITNARDAGVEIRPDLFVPVPKAA